MGRTCLKLQLCSFIFITFIISTVSGCASLLNGGDSSNVSESASSGNSGQNGFEEGNESFFTSLEPGTVVAKLRTENTADNSFILRGTMPIPKGGFPMPGGQTPFAIMDTDGSLVPAQVQTVSRYPDANDGADIVELVARVKKNTQVGAGELVTYDVVYSPYSGPVAPALNASAKDYLSATPGLPGTVKELLQEPDALKIRARDVDGNVYEASLLKGAGSKKPLGSGPIRHSYRTYNTMELVSSSSSPQSGCGPLPHLFGVHAYFRVYDNEELVMLDLRINNGPSDQDKGDSIDDPLDAVYYESIELLIPDNLSTAWNVVQEPANVSFKNNTGKTFGKYQIIELVSQESNGKMHMLPRSGQYNRRLAVTPKGEENHAKDMLQEQGRAFAVAGKNQEGTELFSWENKQTARYMANRVEMPDLLGHISLSSIYNKYNKKLGSASATNSFLWAVATGLKGNGSIFKYDEMGIGNFLAGEYGGVTSGNDIHMIPGYEIVAGSSRIGYRAMQMYHWATNNRQPTAYYNQQGEPAQLEDLLTSGKMAFTFYNTPQLNNPFGYGKVSKCQYNWVNNNGLKPWYWQIIQDYEKMDQQHLIRYTKNAKFLTWIGNDELAKDDLRREAEVSQLSDSNYPSNPSNGSTLYGKFNKLKSKPNVPIFAGRDHAWGMDTMAAYYAVADDNWRAKKLSWFEMWADVSELAHADCSAYYPGGFMTGKTGNKLLPWTGETYIRIQTWEEMLLYIAQSSVINTVFKDVDAARVTKLQDSISKSSQAMIAPMSFNVWSSGYGGVTHSTVKSTAVAYNSSPFVPFCTPSQLPANATDDFVDPFYTAGAFGTSYLVTGDPVYLDKSVTTWSTGNHQGLHTWLMNQKLGNIEGNILLLSAVRKELGIE